MATGQSQQLACCQQCHLAAQGVPSPVDLLQPQGRNLTGRFLGLEEMSVLSVRVRHLTKIGLPQYNLAEIVQFAHR